MPARYTLDTPIYIEAPLKDQSSLRRLLLLRRTDGLRWRGAGEASSTECLRPIAPDLSAGASTAGTDSAGTDLDATDRLTTGLAVAGVAPATFGAV